jgi:uncharacterized membrane protein
MNNKFKFLRLITIGNNFIGSIAGFLALLGIINLITGGAIGLGSRGSRGNAIALTSGDEVFLAVLVALVAGIYYLGLEKIRENNDLSGLLSVILGKEFLKFYAINAVIITSVFWIFDEYGTAGEIIMSGIILSLLSVFHLIVISTAYMPGTVAKLVQGKVVSADFESSEIKLQKLQEMHAKGLITEDEYKKKREEVISSL